jgi:4-carboxymuconolactone decarboxylase
MRIPYFEPDRLDTEQRSLYESLTTSQRVAQAPNVGSLVGMTDSAGHLQGPFNAMLCHPRLGLAIQELGRRLRFEGVLSERAREIVILIVAESERSDFEWAGHEKIAISVGVTEDEVEAIGRGEDVGFADPADRAAAELARALIRSGDVDDHEFRAHQESIGDDGVFEVSTTVGVYQLLAQQMRLFRVDAPPGPWA